MSSDDVRTEDQEEVAESRSQFQDAMSRLRNRLTDSRVTRTSVRRAASFTKPKTAETEPYADSQEPDAEEKGTQFQRALSRLRNNLDDGGIRKMAFERLGPATPPRESSVESSAAKDEERIEYYRGVLAKRLAIVDDSKVLDSDKAETASQAQEPEADTEVVQSSVSSQEGRDEPLVSQEQSFADTGDVELSLALDPESESSADTGDVERRPDQESDAKIAENNTEKTTNSLNAVLDVRASVEVLKDVAEKLEGDRNSRQYKHLLEKLKMCLSDLDNIESYGMQEMRQERKKVFVMIQDTLEDLEDKAYSNETCVDEDAY